MPDFGPLASGSLSGGDTLDDGGGEDQGALAGNQDATTGDTETGSMGIDTAALGGGAAMPAARASRSRTPPAAATCPRAAWPGAAPSAVRRTSPAWQG